MKSYLIYIQAGRVDREPMYGITFSELDSVVGIYSTNEAKYVITNFIVSSTVGDRKMTFDELYADQEIGDSVRFTGIERSRDQIEIVFDLVDASVQGRNSMCYVTVRVSTKRDSSNRITPEFSFTNLCIEDVDYPISTLMLTNPRKHSETEGNSESLSKILLELQDLLSMDSELDCDSKTANDQRSQKNTINCRPNTSGTDVNKLLGARRVNRGFKNADGRQSRFTYRASAQHYYSNRRISLGRRSTNTKPYRRR